MVFFFPLLEVLADGPEEVRMVSEVILAPEWLKDLILAPSEAEVLPYLQVSVILDLVVLSSPNLLSV